MKSERDSAVMINISGRQRWNDDDTVFNDDGNDTFYSSTSSGVGRGRGMAAGLNCNEFTTVGDGVMAS